MIVEETEVSSKPTQHIVQNEVIMDVDDVIVEESGSVYSAQHPYKFISMEINQYELEVFNDKFEDDSQYIIVIVVFSKLVLKQEYKYKINNKLA